MQNFIGPQQGSPLIPNSIALHAWKIKLPEALNESPLELEAPIDALEWLSRTKKR